MTNLRNFRRFPLKYEIYSKQQQFNNARAQFNSQAFEEKFRETIFFRSTALKIE